MWVRESVRSEYAMRYLEGDSERSPRAIPVQERLLVLALSSFPCPRCSAWPCSFSGRYCCPGTPVSSFIRTFCGLWSFPKHQIDIPYEDIFGVRVSQTTVSPSES